MVTKLKIFTPLRFLKLKGAYLGTINWAIPSLTAIILSFLFLSSDINIFGQSGFIKSINSLLAVLVGFYIAALAAIASFTANPSMDKKIAGDGVQLIIKRGGQKITEHLSRRKFLCLLFGFNAFSSLSLYMIGEFAYLFADKVKTIIQQPYLSYALMIFLLVYFFGLINLFMTTLLGLHYLSDRMHRD